MGMINSVLYATSLEAKAVSVVPQEMNLAEFMNDLKSAYEGSLEKKLSLAWDYPPDLPVIQTDGTKLKHILQNLINNAIKFTEKGEVKVSARVVQPSAISDQPSANSAHASRLAPHAFVEFKVADTGIGIPQEMQSIIFEKFKQIDSSETRLYGGVGLGLYIVKQFTEILGGTVEVESEPGKGSTFTVRIPL